MLIVDLINKQIKLTIMSIKSILPIVSVALFSLFLNSCVQPELSDSYKRECDAQTLEKLTEAYIYGFPLVMMELTKQVAISDNSIGIGHAPINQFDHIQEYPDENYTDVIRASVDILYSTAWLNLSQGPLVLHLPEIADRYCLFPVMDAWTNVVASPGTRTTGTNAQDFLITGPSWNGSVPAGMTEIKCPTNMAWVLGRIQVNSKEDGETVVKAIQDGVKLTPLNAQSENTVNSSESIEITEEPSIAIFKIAPEVFFNFMNELMVENPSAKDDSEFLNGLKSLGIGAGKHFNINNFSPYIKEQLVSMPSRVKNLLLTADLPQRTSINEWAYYKELGDYGTHYTLRALMGYAGFGANLNADALYPGCYLDSTGNPLNASQYNYVLHFNKGELPPVNAFWSLSAYNSNNFFMGNELDRFSLGSRDALHFNEDGSLDLYIQYENPGAEYESNWLPVHNGIFNLTMRLYWPKQEAFDLERYLSSLSKTPKV